MVERCGDRQRKFDGFEKWPLRPFIESLPIILQIALLPLTCGLSRYMWSVNTSVARVVISFTVLGVLFYLGIVVAGMSSYECPFQTPGSTALRRLRQSKTIRVLLGSLSPLKVISLVYTAWKKTRWALVLAPYRVYKVTRSSSFREISVSRIRSGIRSIATKVGHQAIILLLQIDRVFGNVKQRLVQGAQRFSHVHLLPAARARESELDSLVSRDSTSRGKLNGESAAAKAREFELDSLVKRQRGDPWKKSMGS